MTEEEWKDRAQDYIRGIERIGNFWGLRLVPNLAGVRSMLENAVKSARSRSIVWKDDAKDIDQVIRLAESHLADLEKP